MDEHHAEVVADKLLGPAQQEQRSALQETNARRLRQSEKHKRVVFAFIGAVIGGGVAYFGAGPILLSLAVGGGIGSLIGVVLARYSQMRNA